MCQLLECHIPVDKLIPGLLILIFIILHLRNVPDLTWRFHDLSPEGVFHEWCGCEQGHYKTKKGALPPPIVPVIRLPQAARSCGHGGCRNPPNPQDRKSLAPGLQQRC